MAAAVLDSDLGQWVAFQPERASRWCRVNSLPFPPCHFITGAVQLAMMSPTQRHGELIAHLSPHSTALCKAKVMRIRRAPPANETSLLSNQPDVLAVTSPPWLSQRQRRLVNR